jgi:NADH:ubiquinone oxidoreductase subunit K
MSILPLSYFLLAGAALFSIGLATVLVKRNVIAVLMGIELMLNAANLNLVAFSRFDPALQGQLFALFVLIVAAAEIVVGLALVLQVYRHFQTVHLDEIRELKN